MINQTTASAGHTAPASTKFNALTGASLERAIKAMEYDEAKQRVEPYIVDMTKQLPEVLPLVSINGSCLCSVGNISAVCGEAKSRKTFLTSGLVASAMAIDYHKLNNFKNVDKNHNLDVLWVDTEQGEMHVRKVVDRISEMTGAKLGGLISEPRLTTLALRELAPHERKQRMYDAMMLMHYDLVVIDGIADLQRNTNDLEESDALVTELMALSTLANTHILCVLHTNPGSDKARGHLGSSLQRKAETVLFVHRVGDMSVVEPQFCRNEPFERFAFSINEEGIPEICDLPDESDEERHPAVALLEDTFGGAIERATLVNKLIETQGINRTTSAMQVSRLIKRGDLLLDGKIVKSPNVTMSQCHNVTGGGGSVTSVTERDKCDEVDEFEKFDGSNEFDESNGLHGSNGVAPTPDLPQGHLTHLSHNPHLSHQSHNSHNSDTAPQQEHIPLYERIHDMFPDIKPQQSMAAWDDDCPF